MGTGQSNPSPTTPHNQTMNVPDSDFTGKPDNGYLVTIECRIPDIQFVLDTGYPAIYPTIRNK